MEINGVIEILQEFGKVGTLKAVLESVLSILIRVI